MCGITGFLNYRNDELIKKMADSISHRGPDEDGFYLSDEATLAIKRLKIIDLNTGSQPIYNEDKSIVIVFNGEIYNYREKRDFLIAKGHKFKTRTDTEVIVHLYEEYGENCLSHLRGMFAFALWDIKNKVFILARDHFGIKPLFYYLNKNRLYFASELKALLNCKDLSLNLNEKAVLAYFSRLYVPQPDTIYSEIKKMPAAHYLIYRSGEFKIKKYWQLEKKREIKELNAELMSEIDSLLTESIKEQLISDVPLGLFLSGGLDSSAILYYCKIKLARDINAYTISYKNETDYDESSKAKIIADFFQASHHILSVDSDIEKDIEYMARNLDQPFADSSIIVNYLICREAKKEIKVALTGIGGDEIFLGYPRYQALSLFKLYSKLPFYLRKIFKNIGNIAKESYDPSNQAGRIKRFLNSSLSFNIDEAYLKWISFLDDELINKFFAKDMTENSIEKKLNLTDGLLKFELENYMEGDLLHLADTASMLNSIEVRVPFLDLRLVELMNDIPFNLKLKNLEKKYILKKILKDKLPAETITSPKHGFQLPISHWFTGKLKDFVYDIINSSSGEFYDKKTAMEIFKKHINKERNFSDLIYAICIWEIWLKNVKK
jgi:asparagine synthase (glutamine-hydrolysing)